MENLRLVQPGLGQGLKQEDHRSQEEIDENRGFSGESLKDVLGQQEFRHVKNKIGVDVLTRTLTSILAKKVKMMLPNLKQRSEEDLKHIK